MRLLLPALLGLVAVPVAAAQTADEKKATVAYLHKLQTKQGGYRADARAK